MALRWLLHYRRNAAHYRGSLPLGALPATIGPFTARRELLMMDDAIEQHQQLVRISRDLFAFFPKATHLSQPYVVLWNRRNGRGRVVILDVTRRQAVARSRLRQR